MSTFLITGCGSGIGRVTALRLAGQGHRVIAAVHDEADGPGLEAEADGELEAIALDVTSPESIEAALERVRAMTDASLDGLVNNAGEGYPGPLEALPIDSFRAQIEVNVTGQLAVTQAFLPLLRAAGGRLVFVASLGGRATFPLAGAYHASKYAIEAVGEALRAELEGTSDVRVSLIEPAAASSEIWPKAIERLDELERTAPAERVAPYRELIDGFRDTLGSADEQGMGPEKVAEAIERALTDKRPSSRYPVGAGAKLIGPLRPLVPDRVADAVTRRVAGS